MTGTPAVSRKVGDVIVNQTFVITRDALVRYAGASGDFYAIHYRDDIARAAGLPGVIAHGMLTMGLAVQPILDELTSLGFVSEYHARFSRPVVVDPDHGATLRVVGTVAELEPDAMRVDLSVTCAEQPVLERAYVRLALTRCR